MRKYLIIFALILTFCLGYFIGKPGKIREIVVKSEEVHRKGKLTSPLLECIENSSVTDKVVLNIKHRLNEYINKQDKSKIKNISVYFRNLNNGPWFGINETQFFAPASLSKVPLAIAYYKKSETDPLLLQSKLLYKKEFNPDVVPQNYKQERELRENTEYTIEDLIERMLVYSDNASFYLLLNKGPVSIEELQNIYSDLGVEIKNFNNNPESELTVQGYSAFFRILYNASYLSNENSEKLLLILTRTTFKQGIIAGIPIDLQVAHKYGERLVEANGENVFQLHDCGIVYYPNYPYLVCIMTKGLDFLDLENTIKIISNIIYKEVFSESQIEIK